MFLLFIMSKCHHNRRKSTCKECGGSSICEHNRIKYHCKQCKADKDESMPADIEEFSLIEVEAAKIYKKNLK